MKSVHESIQDPNFVDMLDRFKNDKECMKTLAQFQPKRNKSNSLRNIFKEKKQEETLEIPAEDQKQVINSANFTPKSSSMKPLMFIQEFKSLQEPSTKEDEITTEI